MAAPCLVKIQSAFEKRPGWLSSFFCRRDRYEGWQKKAVLPRRHGFPLDHTEKIQRNLADILFFLIMKYNNSNIPCVRVKYFTNKGLENKLFYFFKIILYREGFKEKLTLSATFYCSSTAAMF